MNVIYAVRPRLLDWVRGAFIAVVVIGHARADEALPEVVLFNRDIRPILSNLCFRCHGPDSVKRQADLRLDSEQSAMADRGGYRAIVGGDPGASELYGRIVSDDPELRMPPLDSDLTIEPRQIELIRRWIEQGANWQKHWAFIAPQRPTPPMLQDTRWRQNEIDDFVFARLEREGLRPSPTADKWTLIRRLTLDLTGLPPTPEEVSAYLADSSPDAYETLVDRLLNSPHFGERMAIQWLDAARFADTNGYQTDGVRHMWRWRDWVIEAFNRNLSFDQFTIEQLAGDLLPNPTLNQLIATGFNRNHRTNSEGGIIPEEYLVEYVVDRVDTTCTVWLGLTMGCARCHEHKYDPFAQEDFYKLFAYFNNVPEHGIVRKIGNSVPLIKAPTEEMQSKLQELRSHLSEAEQDYQRLLPDIDAAQKEWELLFSDDAGKVIDQPVLHLKLDGELTDDSGTSSQIVFSKSEPIYSDGRIAESVQFDGQGYVEIVDIEPISGDVAMSFGAWVFADGERGGTIGAMIEDDLPANRGLSFHLEGLRPRLFFGQRWLDDAMRVEGIDELTSGQWHHVFFTYDGSQLASGAKLYVDGELQPTQILFDRFTGTIELECPLRVGSNGRGSHFHGRIDEFRMYRRELTEQDIQILACAETIGEIVSIPYDNRSRMQSAKLRRYYFLQEAAPDPIQQAWVRLVGLRRELKEFDRSIPTTMIMQDRPEPQQTHVLIRGQYNRPGPPVRAGVPTALSVLPSDAPDNRLGLARWLVDPANPLTSRVIVNRFWHMYFGNGLVRTLEDFGAQGDPPSHPGLLDWLATEFIRTGWNIKDMQKLIVMSATYRQSSKVTEELLRRDPDNRLLARSPRRRLSAEVVRDQALAASGLLRPQIGGPSVKPYQPKGLWSELTAEAYKPDEGDGLYRRSLYSFWKRTIPPPSMVAFDAPSRETCTLSRSQTNTPLQALALMNGRTYVEAARSMAQRMVGEADADPESRIRYGFQLVLARSPGDEELQILLETFQRSNERFQQDQESAVKLITIGDSEPNASIPAEELAVYTVVASMILNLDEAVTRE